MKPPVPDDLSIEEKRKLVAWVQAEAKASPRFRKFATPDALRHVVGETLDFHRATGNKYGYKDWVAVVKNRIRSLATEGQFWMKRRPEREEPVLPTENLPDEGYGEQMAIGNVIDMLAKRMKR